MADPSATVLVKVAGALKGVVRLPSYEASTGELRAEVARLLGEQGRMHTPMHTRHNCMGAPLSTHTDSCMHVYLPTNCRTG